MNKYLKHLLWLGLLGLSGSAYAQAPHVCGGGPGPNEVMAGMNPGGHGVGPTPLCYWKQQSQHGGSQQSAPQPTGYWVKTWGAMAADGKKGILGTFTGANSKQQAESKALNECQSKGGSCQVFSYFNQCAALVSGDNHYVIQGAENIDVASKVGMTDCQKKDKGCRVHYSACTEPYFVKH
ncbi:DUF4189 domain-containing protein [Acinetobacter sp. C32I]|uniref:DUF4189 domain-containing protein n=1 Tax=Acinetobacter sp. C32I TaxID=2950074 RepID=UPI0020373CA0|nr:DUF4189 domain-containing protein [Acinetobacter sp. C32I]USA54373.1 DUF4189 domain-containing protein [Acinetobacter sp. C32I]